MTTVTIILLLLAAYLLLLLILWAWALVHAATTPRVPFSRRGLWTFALATNPFACMWYWYVWRRLAFWMLFIPSILFAAFLPMTLGRVLQVLSVRDIAERFVFFMTPIMTNFIQVIPLAVAIPLFAFPYVLRLAALAHLGGNDALDAADRNDHAVTFALPLFGYGAALAYCLKWRRRWATVGLLWCLLATIGTLSMLSRV